MFRKFLVNIAVVFHLDYDTIVIYPCILLCNLIGWKSQSRRFAVWVGKSWGYWFLKPISAKIEVKYLDPTLVTRLKDQPIVLVANHQSNLDIPVILAHFFKPVAFVAKMELTKIKVLRLWMSQVGCVFLDRESPREAVKMLQEAVEKIETGISMAIFPQGSRSSELTEFKKGSFKIAFASKVPIVPVTIIGTSAVFQKGKVVPHQSIQMIVHPEINTASLSREEQNALPKEIEVLMQKTLQEQA